MGEPAMAARLQSLPQCCQYVERVVATDSLMLKCSTMKSIRLMFALGIGRCPDSNLFVRLAFEILDPGRCLFPGSRPGEGKGR